MCNLINNFACFKHLKNLFITFVVHFFRIAVQASCFMLPYKKYDFLPEKRHNMYLHFFFFKEMFYLMVKSISQMLFIELNLKP